MIARATMDELGLTMLRDPAHKCDVGERLSQVIRERGYEIDGLQQTGALRRGSVAEPIDLGSEYEGIVYHQWYTTRATLGAPVDDVPVTALKQSLEDLLRAYRSEPREITIIMGVHTTPQQPLRHRNTIACLRALNQQTLERWRYHILVIEQGSGSVCR